MNTDIERFNKCWPFVLIEECPFPNDWSNPKNFSNDKFDPGGKTMCGIIQREYDQYRKHHGLLVQDVRKISKDEGTDIYLNTYYLPHCAILSSGLNLSFFDAAVNEGSFEAIKILQVALGIHNDGEWGDQTDTAVKNITNVKAAIVAYANRRKEVYRQTKNFEHFGADWINRANHIEKHSLDMAA